MAKEKKIMYQIFHAISPKYVVSKGRLKSKLLDSVS